MWLVIVAALMISPIIMMQIVDGDIFTLSLYVVGLAGIFFILQPVAKQWIYIVCLIGATVTINFLPLNFSFAELSVLLVGGHFVVEHVLIRQRGLRVGHLVVVGCILGLAAILFYHWFKQGIGFKVLGGDEIGARKNFAALLGCAAYFLIVTLAKGQWKLLNQVPLFYFLTSLLFLVPHVLTTYVPTSTPYVYRFVSSVNLEAYAANYANEDSLGRINQLGTFAISLEVFLISRFPLRNWWRPERWWVAVLFLTSFVLCLRGGFRSSVFVFVMVAAIGAYLVLGNKSLWWACMGAVMVLFLTVGHKTFFELHPSIQRSLSMMPGQWDPEVLGTARSSDDFRRSIKDIYVNEYLYHSPVMGNGFNYKRSDLYGLDYGMGTSAYGMTAYDAHKGFITRKDFHIGWISLYDAVGLVGGGLFCLLFLANGWLLWKSFRYFPRKQLPPIFIWVTVSMGSSFISFFAVFGAFQLMLPMMCMYSALTWLIYEHAMELRRTGTLAVSRGQL